MDMVMLRITIDLVPFGNEEDSQTIGEMIIGNEHTYANNTANYVYGYRDDKGTQEFGCITRFDRSEGIWKLLHRCLDEGNIDYPEFEDILREKFRRV
jgi:hypothetical protein